MKVPFLDLAPQYREIEKDFKIGLREVIRRGDFILGKGLLEFEKEFARYCQRKFAVGVNSGTDALFLGLLSLGIKAGDEVIVPVFTYIATALAVTFTGAKPVFVDIREDTYNIDAGKIEKAITKKTRAILPVHLYGQAADMKPILEIANRHHLKVVEDCAQAHGAIYKYRVSGIGCREKTVGTMGDVGCFSFYPTKNLGAFGDGGAIVTDSEELYKKLLMLRDYGRRSKYEHVSIGYNSRLDTLQASAVLRPKLKRLNKWNKMRYKNALKYTELLKGVKGIITPFASGQCRHVYNVYAIRVKNRDGVLQALKKKGIAALIHYPMPLHLQEVYKGLGYKKGDFPVSERIAGEVISLPIYPHLKEKEIRHIVKTLKEAVEG